MSLLSGLNNAVGYYGVKLIMHEGIRLAAAMALMPGGDPGQKDEGIATEEAGQEADGIVLQGQYFPLSSFNDGFLGWSWRVIGTLFIVGRMLPYLGR